MAWYVSKVDMDIKNTYKMLIIKQFDESVSMSEALTLWIFQSCRKANFSLSLALAWDSSTQRPD